MHLLYILALIATVNGSQWKGCGTLRQTFTAANNGMMKVVQSWVGKVGSPVQCVRYCHADPNCQSVNYLKVDKLCQLNNVTKDLFPNNFTTDCGSIYYDAGDRILKELLESNYSMVQTTTTNSIISLASSSEVWLKQELSLIGKPSTQSSVYVYGKDRFIASQANDGNTNDIMTNSPYCSHTDPELHPWWRVDLGGEHLLGVITVVNRGDCCGSKLVGATVRVGLSSQITNNMICGSPVTQAQAQDGAWIEFVCDPRTLARCISIDINTGNQGSTIHICEVMVKEYFGQ